MASKVINVSVVLHHLEVGKGTSETMVVSATAQSLKKLLKKGGTRLLEPLMIVEVVCPQTVSESVLGDLSKRRAELIDADIRGMDSFVRAYVPLSELLGYATDLRVLSSGMAAFTMEFHSFRDMGPDEEAKAVRNVIGFSC